MSETSFHLLAILLVTMLVVTLVLVRDSLSGNRKVDLLNPGLFLVGLYLLNNLLVFSRSDSHKLPGAQAFSLAVLFGLLGILFGTFFAYSHIRPSRPMPLSVIHSRRILLFLGLTLLLTSSAMVILMFVRHQGLSGLMRGDSYDRNAAIGGFLSGFLILMPIGGGLSFSMLLSFRGTVKVIQLASALVLFGALFMIASSRGEFLLSTILALFIYHNNIQRIPTGRILIAGLAIFLLMVVLGIVRSRIGENSQQITAIMTPNNLLQMLQPEHLEPFQSGLRDIRLMEDGPPDGKYLYGQSLLHFIPALAPRFLALWDRPITLDAWYVATYAPDVAAKGGGLGFSPLIDAYFNFGYPGCFFVFLVFSFFINRLHIKALRTAANSSLRYLDCFVATTLILFFRMPISGYIKNCLFVFVLAGFLLLKLCAFWTACMKSRSASPHPWDRDRKLETPV